MGLLPSEVGQGPHASLYDKHERSRAVSLLSLGDLVFVSGGGVGYSSLQVTSFSISGGAVAYVEIILMCVSVG